MATSLILLCTILLPALLFLGRRAYSLYVNYGIARQFKIPIVMAPIGWQDDLWLLCWEWFTWLKRVPGVESWFEFTRFSWSLELRFRPHERYGDVFAVVTPGGVEIIVNDPTAINELLSKHRTWPKPEPLFALLDIFGKSVVTVNGEDWQRHRRIVNPVFPEQNNKLVWGEARRQAQAMLDTWLTRGSVIKVGEVSQDCVVIALHVLSAAGFGQHHEFQGGVREIPSGHVLNFADTMSFLLNNAIMVLMFHSVEFPDWMLPKKIQTLKHAVADFKLYMRETIAYTKGLVQGGSVSQTADMASILIKANEAAKSEKPVTGTLPGAKPIYLTDDDLLGNLYILNIAGYETTANALTYTIPYLATNLEIQEWAREEIKAATNGTFYMQDSDYEHVFPQFTRCMALMVWRCRSFVSQASVTDYHPSTKRSACGLRYQILLAGRQATHRS